MRTNFHGAIAVVLVTAFAGVSSFAWQAQEQSRGSSANAGATTSWRTYDAGGMTYKYPPGWQVEPQLYRTPPQEEAGEPESEVGEIISPVGESPTYEGSIWIGGRQVRCEDFGPPCKCFTIYVEVYSCATDAETLRIYDLFLTTIRNNDSNESFHVIFPPAQARLQPGKHYTAAAGARVHPWSGWSGSRRNSRLPAPFAGIPHPLPGRARRGGIRRRRGQVHRRLPAWPRLRSGAARLRGGPPRGGRLAGCGRRSRGGRGPGGRRSTG